MIQVEIMHLHVYVHVLYMYMHTLLYYLLPITFYYIVHMYVGPLAELEYWRQRTAKFSYLVDQIKSQPCRGIITTLGAAKSKAIKVQK